VVIQHDPIALTNYLCFNCSRPPFDDVRLRTAVATATDRASIVRDLLYGYAVVGQSVVNPISSSVFSVKGTPPTYDPAGAQRMAAQALGGAKVEAVLPFQTGGVSRPWKPIGELLQAALAPLGITITLQPVDIGAYNAIIQDGQWNLRFTPESWPSGDPTWLFSRLMKSDGDWQGSAAGQFRGGYTNTEVDSLVAAAPTEHDETKRAKIYERLQELSVTDMPLVALYHEQSLSANSDAIAGLNVRVSSQPTLDTVRLV
jgi:ABC-type transport system substrate-binding protein